MAKRLYLFCRSMGENVDLPRVEFLLVDHMRDGQFLSLTIFKNQQMEVWGGWGSDKEQAAVLRWVGYRASWVEGWPLKRYVSIHIPGACEYDLIWEKGFAGIIKLRILVWDHAGWSRLTLNPMTSVRVFSIFIYLAILGLSCSMQDLWSLLWHEESFFFFQLWCEYS